jgi:succinate dehydrogenase / fumarate reductase iron-sulfur subunit
MKERVVDNKYDPVVWLGRKIFRRDQLAAQAAAPLPVAPPSTAPRNFPPAHTDARILPTNVVWHQPQAASQSAEMGPDGHMAVSEVTFDRQGAASPFGESVEFPLPTDNLTYQHPDNEE